MRNLVVGVNARVPIGTGEYVTAVNFDNAATTPPFCAVMNEIAAFAPWYSSVHRGKGYKSNFTSELYEQARQTVKEFVGAHAEDTVIFTKSTTESANLLAQILATDREGKVVLATDMEHLANDLPWRRRFKVDYIGLDEYGQLSMTDAEAKLKQHKGQVVLVAVTGASNVSGLINPVHKLASLAHKYGAKIFVDGAQLVPHVPFRMNTAEPSERIDFLAFSAHKMYAPFGSGVLIGSCAEFRTADPLLWGGGAVGLTSQQFIEWDEAPARFEAGTPNVMGVIALASAIKVLKAHNLPQIHQRECRLISAVITGLTTIGGVRLYCVPKCPHERVSLISFSLEGMQHGILAQALAQEAGIAVRNGLFCAHPYVEKLLKLTEQDLQYYHTHNVPVPGLVRVSLGLYNTEREVELFVHTMRRIAANRTYFNKKFEKTVRDQRCSPRHSELC